MSIVAQMQLKNDEIKGALNSQLQNVFEDVEDNSKSDLQDLVDKLKEKINQSKRASEKVRYLTMLPKSWGVRKLEIEFNVSYAIARKAKFIHEKDGIGSSPDLKLGKKLSIETENFVREFYYDNEFSREMPGIKDYISVKRDGLRVHAQKRLILGNLKELYIAFKEKHPGHKIGFSKFADLRPKECVLAGRNGTHSVCVCTIHQNFKLMIIGAHLTELTADEAHLIYLRSYKTIISKIVCDSPTSACYFLECQNCFGKNS